MKLTNILSAITLCMAGLSTALADDRTNPVWEISSIRGECRISFKEQADRIGQGHVIVQRGNCPFSVKSYEVASGGDILLLSASGDLLARATPEYDGFYEGTYGDGDFFELDFIGSRKDGKSSSKQQGSQTSGLFGETDGCVRYVDDRRCADGADIGLPGRPFNWHPIHSRTDLIVRFMANKTSSVTGQVSEGVCVEVRNCTERLLNNEVWCEVEWQTGKHGWVLKQDKDFVYAHTSCG